MNIEFLEEYKSLFESLDSETQASLRKFFFNSDNYMYADEATFGSEYSDIYDSLDANTQAIVNAIIQYRDREKYKINDEFMNCVEKMIVLNIELPDILDLKYVVTYYGDRCGKGYVITPILERNNATNYFHEENRRTTKHGQDVHNAIRICGGHLSMQTGNGRAVTPYSLVLQHDDDEFLTDT